MTRVNIGIKITKRPRDKAGRGASGSAKRLVLCDIDDTIWPCTRMVAQRVGVDYEKWTNFRHWDNPAFTDEQKTQIDKAYQDPEHFRQLEFFTGFQKLPRLEEYGAKFKFCSNSMAEAVVQAKQHRMSAEFPQLRSDQLQLNLITPATTLTKKMDDNVYILIDDGPCNIRQGRAQFNIIPAAPWNTTRQALELMEDKATIFVPTGDMEILYQVAQKLLAIPPEGVSAAMRLIASLPPMMVGLTNLPF